MAGNISQTQEPPSSATFFANIQDNLNNSKWNQQKTTIFAYGDPPLPSIDASMLVLPGFDTAQNLIAKYFDHIVTNKFLHRQTVENWMQNLLYKFKGGNPSTEENSKKAVVLMVFASAYDHVDTLGGGDDTNPRYVWLLFGETY